MSEATAIKGLLNGGWQDQRFQPFRDGIEIAWIVTGEPSAALLKYAPGASVPLHNHAGLETILVLDGSQSDERGTYTAGDLVINPEGTQHSVWSTAGCVVLAQWQRPVEFLEPSAAAKDQASNA